MTDTGMLLAVAQAQIKSDERQMERDMALIKSLNAEIDRLRAVVKDAAFALDGVIVGDFLPTGKTVKSALHGCVAILNEQTRNLSYADQD